MCQRAGMGNERAIIAKVAEPYRHLLTVDEFLILDEAGAFLGLTVDTSRLA